MTLPGVNIKIENGALGGAPVSQDRTAGLLTTGVAVTDGIQLDTPEQLFSLNDAKALGIDEVYDTDNGLNVYEQIKDFYDQAGTGAELWIMVVADTVTMVDMLDKTLSHAPTLLDAASGNIRLLAVSRTPSDTYTPTTDNGFDDDAYDAMANAQTLADEYELDKKPFVCLIGARAFTGTAGDLTDLRTSSNHSVSLVLAGRHSGSKDAATGITLGRLASVPVQRNIGRVKDGDVGINEAYLTDGNSVESHDDALSSIHDKGYIIFRKYVGKAGYYFNDDPTATALTNDLQGLARNRVINKAIVLAYSFYVNEVNEEVEYNPDGTLLAGYVKGLQNGVESILNQAMTSESEISEANCFIDEAQDVISTNELKVDIKIIPVGYTKSIQITLGFTNPAS